MSTSAFIHRAAVLFLDVAVLSLAGVLTFYLFLPSEPRETERTSSRKRERAATLVREMLQKRNAGRPEQAAPPLRLNDYEIELAAALPSRPQAGVSFAHIGGLEEQVNQIRRALLLPLERPHLFSKTKLLRPPKGLLLHGSPGTGKTMLARAVATEAKFTFLCLDPARLLSKWYGESNKMAEAYFTLAHKLAPAILFVDEIDCLFPRQRGAGEHEATAALRSQFLSLWDGMLSPHGDRSSSGHVVLIGATNRSDNIDEAILRRMPVSIEVPMPDEKARADVLGRMLRDEAMARELDIGALARECAGYSGSDLEALCSTAAMRPLDELLAREKLAEAAAAEDEGDGQPEVGYGAGGAAEPQGVLAEPSGAAPGGSGARAASPAKGEKAGGKGRVVSGSVAEAELRPLSMDDFRAAMRVVRPSGDRFSRPPMATLAGPPDPAGSVDWTLYD